MTREQDELVLNNQGLVGHILKSYKIDSSEHDDVYDEGMIGLIKAKFDPTKDIKFATFAGRCIINEINMYFRKKKRSVKAISFEELYGENDDKNIRLEDMIEDPNANFENDLSEDDEFSNMINIALNLMTGKERIVLLYHISGTVQREIGKSLNISQSYVARLVPKSAKKLRNFINNSPEFKESLKVYRKDGKYYLIIKIEEASEFVEALAELVLTTTIANSFVSMTCKNGKIYINMPETDDFFSFIAEVLVEMENFNTT